MGPSLSGWDVASAELGGPGDVAEAVPGRARTRITLSPVQSQGLQTGNHGRLLSFADVGKLRATQGAGGGRALGGRGPCPLPPAQSELQLGSQGPPDSPFPRAVCSKEAPPCPAAEQLGCWTGCRGPWIPDSLSMK